MGGVFLSAIVGVSGWFLLAAGIGSPIVAALMISIAIHLAIICIAELYAEGLIDFKAGFLGAATALSLIRGLSTLFAGTALAFAVPGGVLMGLILVALAIFAGYRLFNK